ncbi:MAG: type IX secretion system protein PorQ [Bacteroidales bacterium]|jgi:hypothetical protein|nr:type IX secretion system protein PorQ [Bacteroidales bacterium]
MLNKKILLTIIITLSSITLLFSQSEAGKNGYAILNLYNSARMTSLGINSMPRFSNDASSALTNPSILDSSLNKNISVTYTDLFAGAFQGALAYTRTFQKYGNFGFGLQWINYGKFTQTEENGDEVGSFSVNDYMLTVSWGRQIEKNIFIGATMKPIFSQYESYTAFALAFDLAATYVSNSKLWQASFVVKNIGRQIDAFSNERDTLPFDIQLGVSKQFKHAPVILYVVATDLQKWNIRENDDLNPRDKTNIDGTVDKEKTFSAFLDKGFRHLHFAADITPSKYFYLSLGYSWRQHQEMKVDDAFSLAGLSYGFGINYKKYTLNYARNEYHRYGSPNYITIGYKF